jgi:ATP-dependent helicase/nuclease subunit A
MTTRLSDQDARDAIQADTETSLLVEAGAGSGKTSELARRMVAVIRDGERVDRLAAITFTRKAAGELRGRFQTELETTLGRERDPAVRDRLSKALLRLEQVFTGTVHAFAARLLRERPVEGRVPPGFQELEAAEDDRIRGEAFREALERLHDRGDPDSLRLASYGIAPRDLRDAFDLVCTYDEVDFPAPSVPPPDPGPAFQDFLAWWGPFSRQVPDPVSGTSTCKLQHLTEEVRLALPALSGRIREPGALATLLAGLEGGEKATLKCWDLPKEEVRALEAGCLAFAEGRSASYLAAWRAHVYGLAMPMLLEARREAREQRRREGRLNYQDLLLLAAEMLRESGPARAFFQRRYRRLFVDEFQDTDPVQAELMARLASEEGQDGKDWTALRLRPGALFVVGDPKQSIYRFRRADLATYHRMRDLMVASGGKVLSLAANFRSGKGILDWVNRAFGEILPDYPPLSPGMLRPPGRVAPLTLDARQPQALEAGAGAVARFIRGAVDAGTHQGSDFLVLTLKRNSLLPMARALEALGVPYEASAGASFAESPEVRRLAELATCLADPDDPVFCVGVLRGPLFGISDEDLFRHRKAGGSFRFHPSVAEAGVEEVREALRVLSAWQAVSRRLPPGAALEEILERSGLLPLAASGDGSALAGGALFTALERARALAEGGAAFPEIARALRVDLGSEDLQAAPLEPGRSDVVRLMNLHKAKGLEARVVILADPAPRPSPSGVRVRVLREGEKALGFLLLARRLGEHGHETLAHPVGWEAHRRLEEKALEAERDRLRYVAATRAKELLVICRLAKPTEAAERAWPWWRFQSYLEALEELQVPDSVPAPLRSEPDLSPETRDGAARLRAAGMERILVPSYALKAVTDFAPEVAGRKGVVKGPAGPVWGRLVHGLLELRLRTPKADLEAVGRVLAARIWEIGEEEGDVSAWIPQAVEAVSSVMRSEVWREALAAPERHAEAPLALKMEEMDGAVLRGVVVLAYRVAGGWAIVDWKTDAVPDPEHHRAQLALYAKAWERTSGEKVVRTGLFWVRTGEVDWLSRETEGSGSYLLHERSRIE